MFSVLFMAICAMLCVVSNYFVYNIFPVCSVLFRSCISIVFNPMASVNMVSVLLSSSYWFWVFSFMP